jgi:hypothetical protein
MKDTIVEGKERLVMIELQLSNLPDLPQRASIVEAASNIWPEAGVVALWLGGSLARGAGDRFSDIDFRVAVMPDQLAPWKTPRFEHIFTHTAIVGQAVMQFGDDAVLHHLVLSNGEIFDFFVQSATRLPTLEPLLILGCRSDEFERKLAGQNGIPPVERQAVDGEVVRDLLVSFWINSHKHRKVLYRGLDLMATLGLHIEQSLLLRLWYIEVSGQDCGDVRRQTIHSLTEVVHTIERAMGPQALALLGAPMRDRQELCKAIERNRQAVSQHLGRHLAQQYGFDYLAALEETVLRGWEVFLAGQGE